MHEYSLIQALVESVEAEARARGATAVHRLEVRIGEMAGVDVELFKTAYETFRERTICAHAELAVRMVPVEWVCGTCRRGIARGGPLRCPHCLAPARLAGGDEIILDRIEMEVASCATPAAAAITS
jgi:hydrogenase nickel incorporation protein HypA/HybF